MKKYKLKYASLFLILILFVTQMGFSQECIDFAQSDSGSNWQGGSILGIANLQVTTSVGSNTTNHLYFEDRSGVSLAVNNIDFDGNWLTKGSDGCLCFDYRVNWITTDPSNRKGPNFWIYRIGPGQNISQINSVADWDNTFGIGNNSGLLAMFTPNPSNPTIVKDQWVRYCLPLTDPNGQIPSNADGTWTIKQSIPGSGPTPSSVITLSGTAALSAWNSLITNVDGVILSADYHGNPNEEVSFDNFCWACTDNPPPPPPPDPEPCCDLPELQVDIRRPRFGSDQLSLVIGGISTPIQEIEVSVVDYHFTYSDPACQPADLGVFGNLSSNQYVLNGLNLSGSGTQVMSWKAGSPAVFNGQIPIKISKPNILKLSCCKGTFSVCLKVKVVDMNCNVCEKLVCIELPLEDQTLQQFPGDTTPVEMGNLDPGNGAPVLGPNEVFNPVTGKIWLNKNLGASQVATSPTDSLAYGDLYQWGRLTDGHEKRTSGTTTTLSNSDVPGHGDFILHPNFPAPFTWNSPQNINLWQGVNGANNPCPSGYRIPTDGELAAERLSWTTPDAAGAFAAPLKWTLAGNRSYINGQIVNVGLRGSYWSSYTNGAMSSYMYFNIGSSSPSNNYQTADGASVRCIKN